MSLNEKLTNFQKQQVKCQSMLSSIASSRLGPPSDEAPHLKFSDNTKELRIKYSVRNSPVGSQIKRVIDLLFKTRKALTPKQINEECYVDMLTNKDVFDSMKKNPKAHYDGIRFSYKPEHDVKNKSQLRSLIHKHPKGISVNDLKDAYPNVMEDLQALKDSEDICLLSNSKEDIAYPDGFKCDIKVDDDFKALYRDTEVPSDMVDVEKELRKNGLKPATDNAARRASEQLYGISLNKPKHKKKKEISKRTKLTNTHLPELFQSLK